jgi:hypothetical protein
MCINSTRIVEADDYEWVSLSLSVAMCSFGIIIVGK